MHDTAVRQAGPAGRREKGRTMSRNETHTLRRAAALAVAAALSVAPASAEDDPLRNIDIAGDIANAGASSEAYTRAMAWIRAGGDPNLVVARPGGETVMHVGSTSQLDVLQALVAAGGDCARKNSRGSTPLHSAAAQRAFGPGPAAIQLLVRCGADPNRRNERGRTPLHAVYSSVGGFEFFAASQGGGFMPDPFGGDALIGGKRVDIARALLAAGAERSLNIRDDRGETPLAMVVRGKSADMAIPRFEHLELLLGAGADPDLADNGGVTPLIRTVLSLSNHFDEGDGEEHAERVIRMLLEAGADPDRCDAAGDTPLVHAARYRPSAGTEEYGLDPEIAALLAGGAEPCLAGADGKLPYELAAVDSRGRRLLREAGGYRDEVSGMCFGDTRAAAAAEEALGLDRGGRREVQAALAAQGFDPGAPDGIFGPRTRAALRAWQAARTGGEERSPVRRCGAAAAETPADVAGYLARADIDALTATARAAPEGFEPVCAQGDTPCWQPVENRSGCFVWNPNPQPDETYTWSGECLDGRPHGTGRSVWRFLKDGERRSSSGEGEYRRGIMYGHWKIRTHRGRSWEGPFVDGRRHGWHADIDSGGKVWRYWEDGERVGDNRSPECCVTGIDRAMRVDTSGNAAWLRVGPGEEYELQEALAPGERVLASREVGGWLWVRAQDGGHAGFVHASQLEEGSAATHEAGEVFRDCPRCPEMVVVPSGSFTMGSPPSEEDRYDNEGPRHRVTIGSPFAVGVHEVTFAEWDACVSAGGCGGYRPDDEGRGHRPVVNVSWDDAQSYVAWLSRETGKAYRLLSESEWEYAARAGTETRYWWGNDIGRNRANCNGCGSRWDYSGTVPVGSFAANGFGLHDVHGNVWEWVQDCWNDDYNGTPSDGSAWTAGECSVRVLRGGSWGSGPRNLRAAFRNGSGTGLRYDYIGFRVARTLTP